MQQFAIHSFLTYFVLFRSKKEEKKPSKALLKKEAKIKRKRFPLIPKQYPGNNASSFVVQEKKKKKLQPTVQGG